MFVFVLINYKELVNIDVREIVSAAPSLLPAVLSVLAIYCVKGSEFQAEVKSVNGTVTARTGDVPRLQRAACQAACAGFPQLRR